MMDDAKKAEEEVIKYLSHYSLASIVDQPKYKAALRSAYRRYHALLIWHFDLTRGTIWKTNATKDKTFHLYLDECVSDICQSLFLSFHGLYKPAYLLLRSGVENFFRVIGLFDDEGVLLLTSVYDLIGVVKATKSMKTPTCKKQLSRLISAYAELCRYAHSSGEPYMSFATLMDKFPSFEESSSAKYDVLFRNVVVSICSILSLLFKARLKRMHHRYFDFVSDVLPKEIRGEISKGA